MFADLLKSRVQKIGQPPGTAMYTGDEASSSVPIISVVNYTSDNIVHKIVAHDWNTCLPFAEKREGVTWVNIEGLHNIALVEQIAKHYELHPLTVEDILNVEQRPKVEEFDEYYFIVLRMLVWPPGQETFSVEQIGVVFGQNFVLSFQEKGFHLFDTIRERLCAPTPQRMRQQGADYLAYRLVDAVVDQYFVVLEQLSEQIETVEEAVMSNPTPDNAKLLYNLKHQTLTIRKVVWPMREALSHLLQCDNDLISSFTRVYLRDVYDHIAQAIDAMENFRDALSSMMDVHLTGLTNRMNEIMKVLTIISTIFIPITFVTGIFGMNFDYMPPLHSHWGFYVTLGGMFGVVLVMLSFFYRRKWI